MRRLVVVLVVLAACGCRQEATPTPFKAGDRLEVWIEGGRHEASLMDWEGTTMLPQSLKSGDVVMYLEDNPKKSDGYVRVRVVNGSSANLIASFPRAWLRRPPR